MTTYGRGAEVTASRLFDVDEEMDRLLRARLVGY
jgi:hypothetical protein